MRSLRQLAVEPGRVITHLIQRDGEAANVTQKDLWNLTTSDQFIQRQGMTLIQALYAKMHESPKWIAFWDLGYSGNVKRMFFMHEEQLKLLQRYPDMALADCTYKTNRWKLPLLVILRITPLDTHFSACYCFLNREREEDFEWALNSFKRATEIDISVWLTDRQLALKNAIHKVYPGCKQLLCV